MKVTVKILSIVMCLSILLTPLLTSPSVYAQGTQAEQTEEVTQAYQHYIKLDTADVIELYFHTETSFTKTYPVSEKFVHVVIDGSYEYRGIINLVDVTVTGGPLTPTYIGKYEGFLSLHAVLAR